MKTQCIVFTAPGRVALQAFELPPLARGQVLARTLYTGVSTGTETRVLAGRQTGGTFPCVPGYENVGEVVAVGPGVRLPLGTRVFVGQSDATGPYARLWGGHVEYAIAESRRLIPLPEGIDPVAALYAKTCAIALHGIKRAKVTSKDVVAVVGQGLIGHLATQIAKSRGAKVVAIDRQADRVEASRRAGADHGIDASREDVAGQVARFCPAGLTVAVDATGVAAAVPSTVRLLPDRPWQPPYPIRSRFLLLGSYTAPLALDYDPLFVIEPDLIVSRDCTRADVIESLELLASGKVRAHGIPANIVPFAEAPQAYADLVAGRAMRVIFQWKPQ